MLIWQYSLTVLQVYKITSWRWRIGRKLVTYITLKIKFVNLKEIAYKPYCLVVRVISIVSVGKYSWCCYMSTLEKKWVWQMLRTLFFTVSCHSIRIDCNRNDFYRNWLVKVAKWIHNTFYTRTCTHIQMRFG